MNRTLFLLSSAILVLNRLLLCQWTTDSTLNTPISTAVGNQINQKSTTDGNGGMIIVWEDYRGGQYDDIYAQRIDVSGAVQWTTNGVAVCSASGYQTGPVICSDGSGGALIAWWDRRNEGPDGIFVQRINGAGVVQWTANGINICAQNVIAPAIGADGHGGAVVAWEDSRNIGGSKIYAQRVDSSGNTKWTSDGIQLSTAASTQTTAMVVGDGTGGVIVGYASAIAGNFELHAQRVSSGGTLLWGAAGDSICTAANNSLSLYPAMIADGYGGALFAWEDYRNTTDNDIYAQRVDSTGAARWTSNGVPVCSIVRNQRSASLASDGKGGALIAWRDERRNTARSDIYAQLIDSSGAVQWSANGVAICVTANTEYLPCILGDGAGGGIIAWQDSRTGSYSDIYAQKVDASGATIWNANGIAVSTAPMTQQSPEIVSDGSGGAIITWADYRQGNTFTDIYAQSVSANSVLPVELISFTAAPNENSVTLEWTAATEVNNYGFEVQRAIRNDQQSSTNNWSRAGFVEGVGTSYAPKKYSFIDREVTAGNYSYRLKQIDRSGSFKYSREIEVELTNAPAVFSLRQNFPNPFNPTTTFQFSTADFRFVEMKVYDMLGRELTTLVSEQKAPGVYSVKWDASRIPSGTYIYRLRAGNFVESKKMTLMK
ncbi:MAG TPA: T9SS type A sorting domain-containing protein [Bacteroidota bacterium]|nr:T9SS type A sorting domain-containing protein [Bacteroidota bacterium]